MLQNFLYMYIHVYNIRIKSPNKVWCICSGCTDFKTSWNGYIILESETAWSKENNIGQKYRHEHWYGQSRVNDGQRDKFTLLFQLSSAESVLLSGFDHLHAVIVHEHNHSPSLLQGFQIILDPAVQQHGVFDAGIGSCQIAIFILAPVLF